MKQGLYRLYLSAFLYWLVETYTRHVFVIPAKVISLTTILPPVLGLMWGPLAAVGVYVGGLFAVPELHDIFSTGDGIGSWLPYFGRGLWVFLAGYLPYFLWHKWQVDSEKRSFPLTVSTLWKFLIILCVTFAVTSVFRALTASAAELETVTGLFGFGKKATIPIYIFTCFTNDFFVAIFFDLVWFFFLVSKGYAFYHTVRNTNETITAQEAQLTNDEHKALIASLKCYLIFPAVIAYLDIYQIYGMDYIETWLNFILECLTMIDVYLVLMLYLLLRYRRSIMLEIVFLVAMTVFLSAAVLGWGSSVAMSHLVKSHVDDSLHAMSVICRERLDRTFFCVRQAVNGMERQAINTVDSYERLRDDAAYRKEYLSNMEKRFDDIARGTDGAITYYLHLAPELGGTKSGFFMAREDVRWEGALSQFVEREVTDLALYSPDDKQHVGWYYIPLRSRCATWIEPYIDPTTNSYVISYVAPLFIEEKFIGVIGIEIDFNFIIQELRRMSIYDYGYVYIMNRNNIVLYHKDRFQGSVFQPNPEFQEMEIYLANGMWLGIATPLSKVHDTRNRILMHLVAAILIVAMLISLGSIALASKAIRPLAGMTEAAKRIASGDLNVRISYESGNELGLLVRSIREMAARLEVYVYRDKLTGLRNAAAYISKGTELDAQSKFTSDLTYGVIIFDVNFLKKANDQYGHEAGNELLRHASKVICKVFDHSPVYRIGGDEFAAILERQDYENRKELLQLFDEKIAEETFEAAGDTLTVSVARGLGIYEPGMEFAAVAKRADVAMYNHKSAIKSKFGEDVR
ncbi:MAG: diguanylate cyclase [Selenomonadaceae bacterium]|nr:diguanylate cyclase [Selenomonadaceae bacterium]